MESMSTSIFGLTLIVTVMVFCNAALAEEAPVQVDELRCEYLRNPLGIDSSNPRLSWQLKSEARGVSQTAYQILVARTPETLADDKGDLWDSGKVASDQSVHVPYNGALLESRQPCHWKVRVWTNGDTPSPWSAPGMWTMGLLSAEDWQGNWIGSDWMKNNEGPLPWLRKTFTLEKTPARAMAYVCALGYYELYINGERVGDNVIAPAVTDYAKRGLYITHDITTFLKEGNNCVALWLGRGWSMFLLEAASQTGPLVRAQIEIEGVIDTPLIVATDATWKTHPSPITPLGAMRSGDYGGERYDARQELPGWATAGLDDSRWNNAVVAMPPTPIMSAQNCEPNRILGDIKPAAVTKQEDGSFLIDMGKNFVGWLEMKFPKGSEGNVVHFEYGDVFRENGKLQSYNQRDEYVMTRGSSQLFCPRFNYHAFRYVIVRGLDDAPSLNDICGHWISTDYDRAATFSCSDEMLNRIYDTITWTYRCLTLGGYTVDCPHRERLGYGGDSGTSMEMGLVNFHLGAFFTKWLRDWRDAQAANGDLPFTAPHAQAAGGGPAWSGICITLPWQVYLQYGDSRILEESYPTMQQWLKFLETKVEDGILAPHTGIGNPDSPQWAFLGDWVPPGRKQGKDRVDDRSTLFFNNCYYVYCLHLTSKIAAVLGSESESKAYEEQANALAERLHERFLNEDGVTYVNKEQPYLAMPLLFGITPASLQDGVMKALRDDILITRKGHLNTGMHGTYFMTRYLTDTDQNDLIYSIVSQKTFPGWGYMLENGATTIWEEWDGDNSQIHDTLLSVGMWFVQGLAGIQFDPERPGFKHIRIRPAIVGDLTHTNSTYDSLYGQIKSGWQRNGNDVIYEITIPPNTTASIMLPTDSPDAVQLGDTPLQSSSEVAGIHTEGNRTVFEVGSGNYTITAPAPVGR